MTRSGANEATGRIRTNQRSGRLCASLVIGLALGFAIVAVSLLVFPAYWPNFMPVLGVGIGCGVAGAKLLRIPPRASSHARDVVRA